MAITPTSDPKQYRDMSEPASNGFAITPDDNNNLQNVVRGIFVGTTGDVSVVMLGESDAPPQALVFKNVQGGTILPVRCYAVTAVGTTASDLIGLF